MMLVKKFEGSHYEIGYCFGEYCSQNKINLLKIAPFMMDERRKQFAKDCYGIYEKYFPKVLDEIKGIEKAGNYEEGILSALLFSMYCIVPQVHCSSFVYRSQNGLICGRNSDFYSCLKEMSLHCEYHLKKDYSFIGNTTAYVEMEDGMNEKGLCIAFTSVFPKKIKAGFNSGFLLRYGLEKCANVEEFVQAIYTLPIASAQTFIAMDQKQAVLIECDCEKIAVEYLQEDGYLCAVNRFYLSQMADEVVEVADDWQAKQRYQTMQRALKQENKDLAFAKSLCKGEYGMMCQYEKKSGKDTIWSVIYHPDGIELAKGNPQEQEYEQIKVN